jgi:hypothetical protein
MDSALRLGWMKKTILVLRLLAWLQRRWIFSARLLAPSASSHGLISGNIEAHQAW